MNDTPAWELALGCIVIILVVGFIVLFTLPPFVHHMIGLR